MTALTLAVLVGALLLALGTSGVLTAPAVRSSGPEAWVRKEC